MLLICHVSVFPCRGHLEVPNYSTKMDGYNHFGRAGQVTNVKIAYDRETGRGKGSPKEVKEKVIDHYSRQILTKHRSKADCEA